MLRTIHPVVILFFLCVLVSYGCGGLLPSQRGAAVGQQLPALTVAGWLRGTPPSSEQLSGNLVVIDCWASW